MLVSRRVPSLKLTVRTNGNVGMVILTGFALDGVLFGLVLHPGKLTAKTHENRPGPERKRPYSNHPFSGEKC